MYLILLLEINALAEIWPQKRPAWQCSDVPQIVQVWWFHRFLTFPGKKKSLLISKLKVGHCSLSSSLKQIYSSPYNWKNAAHYLCHLHSALCLPLAFGEGLGLFCALPAAMSISFLYSSSWKHHTLQMAIPYFWIWNNWQFCSFVFTLIRILTKKMLGTSLHDLFITIFYPHSLTHMHTLTHTHTH